MIDEPESTLQQPLALSLIAATGMLGLTEAEAAELAALHARFARDRALLATVECAGVEPATTFATHRTEAGDAGGA